ncbi:15-hydroxyprostaglandin dehydrogenase [NAD(+)]-like [Anoplophora glabripennis]|uniref:15-hydroxyprostaglandin dehydrogenase [NAD(+)]-like n=1 Tax=Anoplophora glabripennis TaxID=217634 RepID=UPI00087538A0|nr:15-hydroxyprostaglandin dehydrogenase [NAD(+)]-like [Anoplophora glabripennis]
MVLDLVGKIALISGGASGIGLRYAKELLRNGVKAVTLADTSSEFAQTASTEIEKEFGPNRALFVKTDVSDIQQFDNAFKKTIEKYKHVDILINNAGILNDKIWEKQIGINVNGVVHGILLGMENYLPKYKQGPEAVIVNMSSIAAIGICPFIPIYCGTKAAVAAMTRSWGVPHHYERTKVRLLAICPGVTATPLIADISGRNLGDAYEESLQQNIDTLPPQEPEYVAKEVTKLIQSCPNGTVWVVEEEQPPYEYVFPERETMPK